jgi:hypothetical protein
MNQLAHSRTRRAHQIRVSQVRTSGGTDSWKSTALLAAGSAIGGALIFEGHMMSGAAAILGTILFTRN